MTTSHYQDLFYRCKFSELLAELARREASGASLGPALSLLKANAEFERHRVQDAKATLQKLKPEGDDFDEHYHYALARLSYFTGETARARELFLEIYRTTDDDRHKFKALLGIANTHYSQAEHEQLPPIIAQLCSFEPLEREDERISLMIFLGNYYFASGVDAPLARTYFKKALAAAAGKTWTYFITRSLYGLAAVCEKDGQMSELLWTLDILTSFVDESEQLFFSHVVNERFKNHYSINTPMEFDTTNRRILIKNEWVPFHDRPLLFTFLLLLHASDTFVGKEVIAKQLWPQDAYKPRLHDPRIFDIAKRARHVIEAYENQPVVLLSGRMGYKLAST